MPKQAELPKLVRAFLTHNRLNPKYEADIVRMVLLKLDEHAASTRRNSPSRQQPKQQHQKQAISPVVPEQLAKNQQQKIKQATQIE